MADKIIASTIQDAVAEQIAGLGPSLESAVVEHLADIERQRRKVPLVQGFENLKKLDIEIKKADKPDMKFTTKEGDKVEAQSEAKLKELAKLDERRGKLVKAIEKAFNDGDVQDLNQINQAFGKGGDKPGGKDQATSESEGSGESS